MPGRQGSIRLFSYSGIDVFLHWSWFLIAMYEIRGGLGTYSSIGWNIAEYLALFLIVTIHEFGHALACRQVGGFANRIVLWPMGGVAYVDPPPRPGATLWSIAAGPLVNVALLPILWIVVRASRIAGLPASQHDLFLLLQTIFYINFGLLVFNILPIYPLDGGQILRSLLWYRDGTCPQPDGRDHSWPARCIRIYRPRRGPRFVVARRYRCLRFVELLGRFSACPCSVAHGQTSTARRIFLPHL